MASIRRHLLLLLLFAPAALAFGQVNRYMVFFTDKDETAYTLDNPLEFLSEKAVERRVRQGIEITPMDFPVNAAYVEGVREAGAGVFFRSRWVNGVLVQCDASLVASLEALPFVSAVEFVAPFQRLSPSGGRSLTVRRRSADIGPQTATQLQMLGIHEMHADNFRGEGMTIAVFDGGFLGVDQTGPFQPIFDEGRFNEVASFDFVRNSGNVFQYDDHGTEVLSVIAAYVPDAYTGGAYKADFQLYVTEDVGSEYRIEEYNWLLAAERADSAGVDIINSSLGYYDLDLVEMQYTKDQMDGTTAVVSKAAQWAADRGILVVCSAGNEGNKPWRIITAPADAKDVIAVANVTSKGNLNASSSRGPTADGRIKPDLAALGTGVRTIRASGLDGTSTGTSLASPLIASLAAGVWQRYPDLSNKELMEVLKASASNAENPNNDIGYGIPNYLAVVHHVEHVGTRGFDVFPNPVRDTLNVRPLHPDDATRVRLELISALGKRVGDGEIIFSWLGERFSTDLSALGAGLYYLRITTGDERIVYRLVKE